MYANSEKSTLYINMYTVINCYLQLLATNPIPNPSPNPTPNPSPNPTLWRAHQELQLSKLLETKVG